MNIKRIDTRTSNQTNIRINPNICYTLTLFLKVWWMWRTYQQWWGYSWCWRGECIHSVDNNWYQYPLCIDNNYEILNLFNLFVCIKDGGAQYRVREAQGGESQGPRVANPSIGEVPHHLKQQEHINLCVTVLISMIFKCNDHFIGESWRKSFHGLRLPLG